jgi:redox-sensitive bicupin YhaK (pirin superfamily)
VLVPVFIIKSLIKPEIRPRYDQQKFDLDARPNEFIQILSPDADDEGVWIYQDAWFNMARFTQDTTLTYALNKKGNGVYIFVLKGQIVLNGQEILTKDGFGIWDTNEFTIQASEGAEVLLMEVPMSI